MFSEISVLTYQTEKTRSPEERKVNNDEIVLLTNTVDKLRTPTKYALDVLWSNWKNKEEEAKRKRKAVDTVLPCKKRRGTASKL